MSYVFRSLRIPLAINVKDRVLEIVGLDPESGLRTGDSNRKSGGILRHFLAVPYSDDIPTSAITVFQFLVVASADSSFSSALLESLVLP